MNEYKPLKNEKTLSRSPINPDKPLPDHSLKKEKPPTQRSTSNSPFLFSYWTAPLILFILAFGSLFIIPRFEKIFGEMDLTLPLATIFVLDLQLSYIAMALSIISFILIKITKNKWLTLCTALFTCAYFAFVLCALVLPATYITETLSG